MTVPVPMRIPVLVLVLVPKLYWAADIRVENFCRVGAREYLMYLCAKDRTDKECNASNARFVSSSSSSSSAGTIVV